MSKRSRSDSLDAATTPWIPRTLPTCFKSETPEIGKASPRRRITRGVESVRVDQATDRDAVMRDTILRLHQDGRRVVADPIVLQSIDGPKNMTFEWLLDYQVREKLEPREPEPDNLWRPAPPVSTELRGTRPQPGSLVSRKQSHTEPFLSTLLGDGETPDDPIVIDDTEEVVESTRYHPVNDPSPSGTSRVAASNPAKPAGIFDQYGLETHHHPTNRRSEDSDSEEDEPDAGAIGEDSDADRNAAPLPHPAFSPQLLPVLAHDWESSEEEILTNEARPLPRKAGPRKGRKKRPETGRSGTAAVPRDSATTIAQPSRKHIQLPLPPNGRARRLVCSSALDIWCAVTMRGDVQFINGILHTKLSDFSMPGESHHHVEDACLVGNTLVIGYGAPDRSVETQIETLNLNEFVNENVDRLFFRNALLHPPHCDRGISSLAPVDNRRFLSGGYDKRIHLWTFSSNNSSVKTSDMKLYLNAPARAIGYAPETKTAYVGSGRRIWNLKVEKPANAEGLPISSEVNSIHVNLHEPDLVVLEVDDLDEQVQLFDIRAGGFQARPAVRFGHRTQTNRQGRHSPPSYRYSRGSLSHCHFARGFADGYVFAWDFRNPKKVAVKLESQDCKQNVVHTAISGLDIATFSTGVVTVYSQVL